MHTLETAILKVPLLFRERERKGAFSLFLREEAVQPGRGLQPTFMPDMLKAPKLQDSRIEGLFLLDGSNFNIFTETRDLVRG